MPSRSWLWVVMLFLTVSSVFHFYSKNIADLDSFYYLGLAKLYRTAGLFHTEFPWIENSAINDSSLWYGFGVFLIPFSFFADPALGIKFAGILLTAALLISYYFVSKRIRFKIPLFWPFLFLFAAPNTMFHLLMVRPQTISIILVPLFFSFLIEGNFWQVVLTAFGIAWFHLNFAWLPIFILIVTAGVRLATERKFNWKIGAGGIVGVLAGWLLRPHPIAAAKLFYIQVLQQMLEKQGGLPLLFGKENLPLPFSTLFQNFSPFLLLWIPAIVILFFALKRMSSSEKTLAISNIILSLTFLGLTTMVARRAYDFLVIFGVFSIALAFNYLESGGARQATKLILASIFVFMFFYSGYKTSNSLTQNGYAPDYLKDAASWLKDNSNQDDVVFNLHWSNFSPLFFWNQKNHYIAGLDPIFQYAYNPTLYWKFHYLSADLVTKKTCGAIECTREMLEDTYQVLVKDFNAKYLLLEKDQNPAVNYFLENDLHFEKKFEANNEVVYAIKR